MGDEYTKFLTDRNVLLVVSAYLEAYEHTSIDTKASLVHKAIKDSKPRQLAALLDCQVTKVYEYRRKDLGQRQADIRLDHFVKMMSLND